MDSINYENDLVISLLSSMCQSNVCFGLQAHRTHVDQRALTVASTHALASVMGYTEFENLPG
jgi:hypothetical protein